MDPLELYRVMLTAREIDRVEAELTGRGEAFFHVSGAGHEATAVLAGLLTPEDWLHCHYRDKALMLARGVPPQEFFDALYCNANSHSSGRQMCAHLSNASLRLVSMVGSVGNSALHSVGIAAEVKHQTGSPLVLCSVGDGTTQQGEFLEGCAEAARDQLPVLFLVEDNGWAISTTTEGKTFYSLPGGAPAHLFGIPIQHINGRDVLATEADLSEIVAMIRVDRTPVVAVMHVARLANHTNADDQRIYRDEDDIRRVAANADPIRLFERQLKDAGCGADVLEQIHQEVVADVAAAEERSRTYGDPEPIATAKRPLAARLTDAASERPSRRTDKKLTMKDALRDVLRHHLATDERVTLYGEDIADPKGDVFGVTKGLSTEFGARVRNSPLSESTIVGSAVGRAMAGGRPVAFLQFADFLPLAYNQFAGELGTLYWRSNGEWEAPVIIMAACGAYRPGLGPFHAQTMEAIAAHTPGIDVFMPSTAADAAGMLNAAFASGRPTLFLYPKSCLNDPENTTGADVAEQFTPIGPARVARTGRNITLVGWGNTVRICEKVADTLETVGLEAEVIDLRSISPWDKQTVLASAEKTANLVVVHEDNHTCGLGAELLATVTEEARLPVATRRVTRSDTLVPCNYTNQTQVLPTFQRVLSAAAELLDLDVTWTENKTIQEGVAYIEAVGSGPADETVIIAELHVEPGATIQRGDVVASLEATKSVFDLTAAVSGKLEEVLVKEGDTVLVGAPIMRLESTEASGARARLAALDPGTPTLAPKRTTQATRLRVTPGNGEPRARAVGISSVNTVQGSRVVTNRELVNGVEGLTDGQVVDRTGIACRCWVAGEEDAVSMAARAARELLERQKLALADIDLVVCTTTTPKSMTPSTACQILEQLATHGGEATMQAYDINAACSGYLYALQAGYDFLQTRPEARVLVVTAEALSPLLDRTDQDTVFLFGDASSATILYGERHLDEAWARLYQADLCAKPDVKDALCVPFAGEGFISMNGRKVFSEAVRSMISSLNRACNRQGLGVADLDLVVPHQANDRITQAIQRRIGVEVYSNIRNVGNTSSTSIPLCLEALLPTLEAGTRIGLCAFGGGFTFGASIVEVLKQGGAAQGITPPKSEEARRKSRRVS